MTSISMSFWKKLTTTRQRWMALPVSEKKLVIEAWFDLLLVAVLLRSPLHRRLLAARPAQAGQALGQPSLAVRLVNATAAFHIKPMTCLERAIVAQRILRRRGCETTLRLGVQRAVGQTEAHAWLEHNGQPLDESAPDYAILREISTSGR